MQPVLDVGIAKRYPWAGELTRLTAKKIRKERTYESSMEPFFGNIMTINRPPTGRAQQYELRRGYQSSNLYPKWLNQPPTGLVVKPKDGERWRKDRRPRWNEL